MGLDWHIHAVLRRRVSQVPMQGVSYHLRPLEIAQKTITTVTIRCVIMREEGGKRNDGETGQAALRTAQVL